MVGWLEAGFGLILVSFNKSMGAVGGHSQPYSTLVASCDPK